MAIAHTFSATPVAAPGVTSLAISLTIAANDNLAVIGIILINSTNIVTSVTDSQGANWTFAFSHINTSSPNQYAVTYYTQDLSTTGSRTITVNVSSSINIALNAAVFSGAKASSPFIAGSGYNGTGVPQDNFFMSTGQMLFEFVGGGTTASSATYAPTGAVEVGIASQGGSPSNRVCNACAYYIAPSDGTKNASINASIGTASANFVRFDFEPESLTGKIKVTDWKNIDNPGKINIGGVWKTIASVKINVGGVWKDASTL